MGEGGWGFEVPAQGKQIDLALEFMRFLTTYEAQFTWSQIYGGFSPACKALQNSAIYAGNTALKRGQRRILVSLQNTHYQGNGYDPQCEGLVTQIVDQVRTGKMNAADASKEMQKQLTEQQKRYAV
jgi:ABC-type glycerol-3-phosphate transport system substrate-binding protein